MHASRPLASRALFAYATATAACTLVLVCLGGLVTSKGVGMAVPDWPTSYGYNMFLFPPSQWVGGVFDEHVHRLAASTVGFLTVLLAAALQWGPSRPAAKRLGWAALGLVLVQGLLGGLRVVLDKQAVAGTSLGVVFGLAHACAGQAFFCVTCVAALWVSPYWDRLESSAGRTPGGLLSRWAAAGTVLIFLQLMLGAAMRHQHAGLAVHDFPTAYGQWWPATDASSLRAYNLHRTEEDPVTAFQILLHMAHRFGAMSVAAVVLGFAATSARLPAGSPAARWGALWAGLIVLQATLGVVTVLANKPADVATAHVAVGALSLATGVLSTLVARRTLSTEPAPARVATARRSWMTPSAAATKGVL